MSYLFSRRTYRGFTLIELLVVISIISLLASVVLASLNSARDKGRLAAGKQFEANVFHAEGDQAVGIWDMSDCSGTTASDRSGNNNNAALTGSPSWSSDTPSGSRCSLSLNGSTMYGKIASLGQQPTGNSAITVAAWVKSTSISGSDRVIACAGVDTGGPTAFGIAIDNVTGRYKAAFSSNNGRVDGVSSAAIGKWQYIVGVYDTTSSKIFVDGALENSASYTAGNLTAGQGSIGVWCNYTTGNNWNGLIDNVRIFSKALTASEIGKLYAEGLPTHRFAER